MGASSTAPTETAIRAAAIRVSPTALEDAIAKVAKMGGTLNLAKAARLAAYGAGHPVVPLGCVKTALRQRQLLGWVDAASPTSRLLAPHRRERFRSDPEFWAACADWLRWSCRRNLDVLTLLRTIEPRAPIVATGDEASCAEVVAWAAVRMRYPRSTGPEASPLPTDERGFAAWVAEVNAAFAREQASRPQPASGANRHNEARTAPR